MRPTNRRSAIGIGLASIAAHALASRNVLAAPASQFVAPPANGMRYRRVATRELGTNAAIVVTREFAVEFRQFADGFMLHGQQVSANVDAPANLARFAALEEQRDESGLFPIALSPFGQIMSARIAPRENESLNEAIDHAVSYLAEQSLGQDERELLSQSIIAMQSAGSRITAYLPTDLFAPTNVPRRLAQSIALPGGLEGSVETNFAGARDLGTGLMREAEREVVTQVEGSVRRSIEAWSLAAA